MVNAMNRSEIYEIEKEKSRIEALGLSDFPSAIVPQRKATPNTNAEIPYTQPISLTGTRINELTRRAIVYLTIEAMTFSWDTTDGSIGTPAAV
jgi:hypothetical protein